MTKLRSGRSGRYRKYRSASQSFTEGIQTRLKVGKPNDKFEQEADRVAEKITVTHTGTTHIGYAADQPVQRQFLRRQEEKKEAVQKQFKQRQGQQEEDKLQKQEEKKEPVQASYLQTQAEEKKPPQAKSEEEEPQAKFIQFQDEKKEEPTQAKEKEEPAQPQLIQQYAENKGAGQNTPAGVDSFFRKASEGKKENTKNDFDFEGLLEKTKAGGISLDHNTLEYMNSKMGHNFSSVRIHTGPDAERLAKHMHAQAFTVGNHIFFNAGKFQPDTEAGIKLLAHELTHVIQQGK
jgi:hypothetical protein